MCVKHVENIREYVSASASKSVSGLKYQVFRLWCFNSYLIPHDILLLSEFTDRYCAALRPTLVLFSTCCVSGGGLDETCLTHVQSHALDNTQVPPPYLNKVIALQQHRTRVARDCRLWLSGFLHGVFSSSEQSNVYKKRAMDIVCVCVSKFPLKSPSCLKLH